MGDRQRTAAVRTVLVKHRHLSTRRAECDQGFTKKRERRRRSARLKPLDPQNRQPGRPECVAKGRAPRDVAKALSQSSGEHLDLPILSREAGRYGGQSLVCK